MAVTLVGTCHPSVLGNAVIERIVGNGTVAASSCIACHAYASFGANGQPSKAAVAMLPYNPTGAPIPAVLEGLLKFDFRWGVVGTGVMDQGHEVRCHALRTYGITQTKNHDKRRLLGVGKGSSRP